MLTLQSGSLSPAMDIVAHLHFPHFITSGVSSECGVFYCVPMYDKELSIKITFSTYKSF